MKLPAKKFYTILGVDPGKTNAAYSVVRIKVKPFRYKILAHGMLKNPVQDLTGQEVLQRFAKFKREVSKIKRTYGVDAVFAERFMTRGGQSMGTTIEVVGIMLALLAHVGIKNVQYVTAAQWKNQWNRKNDLKAFYESMKPLPAHPIDATGIALYGASQLFDEIPCFEALNNMKQLVKQIHESNKEPVNAPRNNRSKNKTTKTPRATRATSARGTQKATGNKEKVTTRSTRRNVVRSAKAKTRTATRKATRATSSRAKR